MLTKPRGSRPASLSQLDSVPSAPASLASFVAVVRPCAHFSPTMESVYCPSSAPKRTLKNVLYTIWCSILGLPGQVVFGFPFAEEETKAQGGDSLELAIWGTAPNLVCLQTSCFLQDTIILSYSLSFDAIIRKRIQGWGGWGRWPPSPHRESRLAL